MKRFLKKSVYFFLTISTLLLIGFLIPSNLIKENLHYSIYDKHQLLAAKKVKPRIILVGGSNLSFGIYSPLIEQEFDMEVINSAIHAGYGLKYIIDDIKPFIKERDIVILAPEYSHFFDNFFYGDQALIQSISVYPSNWKILNWQQILICTKFLPKEALVKIKSYLTTFFKTTNNVDSYHRKSFNRHGDAVNHWNYPKPESTPTMTLSGELNQVAIDYVRDFSKYIEQKNAHFYFSFPCLNQSSFKKSEAAINTLYAKISKEDFEIIAKPFDYSTEDSLHFDTHYHLTKEGQYFRTKMLIDDLKEYGLEERIRQ